MGISEMLSLCGGLALFLYGMHMMSSGLEAAAGDRMKQMLEKLTSNTIMGVVIGTVITALIQSSSATTVMLVGFVNSGIMDLSQTVGIIMGANIGATMNGVLLAVGIGDIAPAFAFIGVCLIQFTKDEKKNHIGEIIAGLGILFIGMNMMSSSMSALRNSPAFIGFLSSCSNPILAILVGTVFTALIQSSSASVGILQALAVSGVVDLHTGIYLMFGFTIGTCITAAIASIGTTANAKRTTVIHFLFNVIGTVIFVIFCQTMPGGGLDYKIDAKLTCLAGCKRPCYIQGCYNFDTASILKTACKFVCDFNQRQKRGQASNSYGACKAHCRLQHGYKRNYHTEHS